MSENNENEYDFDEMVRRAEASGERNIWLRVAAERLSIVRYVFLVQIEDGIPTAPQRAALEYADAVLIGWPDTDAEDVVDVQGDELRIITGHVKMMEEYISRFRECERENDIDGMTDVLIRISEQVAEIRKRFQPGFPLPTFAEIRRVVQEEWDEDMDRIDPDSSGSASEVENESKAEDAEQRAGGQA